MNRSIDEIEEHKIFIDDFNHIRLINPDLLESTSTLKNESEQFIENIENFKSLVSKIRTTAEEIGQVADKERLRAMNAQNELQQLDNASKNNLNSEESQKLKILVHEKQIELERLKVELESYKQIQAQQQQYIQKIRASFGNA